CLPPEQPEHERDQHHAKGDGEQQKDRCDGADHARTSRRGESQSYHLPASSCWARRRFNSLILSLACSILSREMRPSETAAAMMAWIFAPRSGSWLPTFENTMMSVPALIALITRSSIE